MDLGLAIVIMMILLTAFGVIFILGIGGFDFEDFFRFIKHKVKDDVDEVIIEKPIDRERQRELLMEYCRDISVTSVHDVERKFNFMCIQILEDNPEICTIEELMEELDKIDKNLLTNLLKEKLK